ncbi:MAG: flagellar biosynthesis protein FlhB [Helicobacteraceae bacterium]|jgi:flagellar biosynthetic protein FlhB|nr:flagellar biosynthesis protein FlhB [Helicobacteraceae bacterium]
MAEGSAEKTEEATPKRIEDARKEGNVPKSVDMAGFAALMAAVIAFAALFGYIAEYVMRFFRYCASFAAHPLETNQIAALGLNGVLAVLKTAVPLAALVALFGAIGYIAQFGFLFTTKPLVPDLKKINPIKGFGNLFSMQRLIDGVKITLKVFIALGVAGYFLWKYIKQLPTVGLFSIGDQIAWLAEKSLVIAVVMLLVFFSFALIDISITRYYHFKRLRMSKQEVLDEYKNIEGSPEVKARIRRIQTQMSRRRMMKDLEHADVVVTNPTHFAVALRYKPNKPFNDRAPVVVAKGADNLAITIKAFAREYNIAIIEDPPLARELYRLVDIGRAIPQSLFDAVIELFKYVAETTGKRFI